MHPLYTPHNRLRPAFFPRDVLVHTTLAMRGGNMGEYGVLYRTFQRSEVRAWSEDGRSIGALAAWLRVDEQQLPRVVEGDLHVLDELDAQDEGRVLVLCELWTPYPGVAYRLCRELTNDPKVEWLVGRRGQRWRAHRVRRRNDGTDLQRRQRHLRVAADQRVRTRDGDRPERPRPRAGRRAGSAEHL